MDKRRIKLLWNAARQKGKEYIIKFIAWRKYRTARYHGLSRWGKVGNKMLTFAGFFLLYLVLVDINFLWLFGKSPSLKSISDPPQLISSEIISTDGQVIGKYFDENRKLVKYENISPALINTLVSAEDIRFYRHFGIDIQGLFAAFKDMLHGNARGASTITQQLVKNMYKTRSQYSTGLLGYVPGLRLLIGKTKEWTAAIKIELMYSKKEILAMYLNTVNFSSNAYGIHTAAKTYYGTTPDKLTYEQSAVLVGMLKAVTVYNPYLYAERAKERRNVVLQQLAENKFITQQMADSLKQSPLALNYRAERPQGGIAPYFCDHLAKFLEKWGEENGYDIYADGLKIYVTIDSRLQKYAEEAVQKQMKQLQERFSPYWLAHNSWRNRSGKKQPRRNSIDESPDQPRTARVFDYNKEGYKKLQISMAEYNRYMQQFLHCGFVAMEPDTKHVKAWVGDVSYDYWQYDKVAQSKRQPGSTFKLFVYTAAMLAGKSPCDKLIDEPVNYKYDGGVWKPKNANETYGGYPMTLKAAFAQSVNSIAAQVAQKVGISNVAKCARMMGIQSKLVEVPSLCLGSSEVSLLELVNAYTTIVSEGMYHAPVIIKRIEDNAGNTIYEANPKPKRVISYENAFLMIELLKGGVTEPGGTSRALWSWNLFRWDTDFGGKTGTTSNYSDAWYVGVTPKLVGGAWVGAEKRSDQFGSSRLGQGSRAALPVFAMFMEKVLSDKNFVHYRAKFPKEPKEPISRAYKCSSYVPPETNEVDPLADPAKTEDVAEEVPKPAIEAEEKAAER
ncbi:MAG: transglycosylase domain-containing protein [Smithella sp.]